MYFLSLVLVEFYNLSKICIAHLSILLYPVKFNHLPGYIGEFEIIDDHRAGKIVVNLTGRLNKASHHLYSTWPSKFIS